MDLADYKSYLKILLIEDPSAVLSHLHDAVKRNSNTYDDIKRYYNLLFTGEKILLEGVGLHGGNDYTDFVHLDHGIGYSIKDGQELDITLNVDRSKINLFIDDEFMYTVNKPGDLIGKVGLRPWRARLECSFFEVTEK